MGLLFSPCDLCGGRDYELSRLPVRFEAEHPLDYSTETLSVCTRCYNSRTDGRGILWAMPCDECGQMSCTQEDLCEVYRGTTTNQGPDPSEWEFRCHQHKIREFEP